MQLFISVHFWNPRDECKIFPVEKHKQTSHCLQLLTAGAKNDFTEPDMTSVAVLFDFVMCVDDCEYFSVLGDFTFR